MRIHLPSFTSICSESNFSRCHFESFLSAAKLFLNSRNTASSHSRFRSGAAALTFLRQHLRRRASMGWLWKNITIGDGLLLSGWWFQTCFFHNIWDNPSHWLIFFRPPTSYGWPLTMYNIPWGLPILTIVMDFMSYVISQKLVWDAFASIGWP